MRAVQCYVQHLSRSTSHVDRDIQVCNGVCTIRYDKISALVKYVRYAQL